MNLQRLVEQRRTVLEQELFEVLKRHEQETGLRVAMIYPAVAPQTIGQGVPDLIGVTVDYDLRP